MLPGVRVNIDPEPGPDRGAFQIGAERYRMEPGITEYVLLARLTAGEAGRPGRCSCSAASARSPTRPRPAISPATTSGWPASTATNSFVLLLKVVNSQAYGPDVVELVADVTKSAQTPLPVPPRARRTGRSEPGRHSHRPFRRHPAGTPRPARS